MRKQKEKHAHYSLIKHVPSGPATLLYKQCECLQKMCSIEKDDITEEEPVT